MKKIILLSAVLLAVNFAFAAGDDTVATTSDNKVTETKQETKLVAENNKHESSKWYGGASKSLCKSWKERGVGWEIWPLYKMGKSSCEVA